MSQEGANNRGHHVQKEATQTQPKLESQVCSKTGFGKTCNVQAIPQPPSMQSKFSSKLFVHSFNIQLLSAYCVLGPVLHYIHNASSKFFLCKALIQLLEKVAASTRFKLTR